VSNHHYMCEHNVVNRLVKEWQEHGKLIVAYDFDNTVFDYHGEGHDYTRVVNLIRECKKLGAYLIVFTAAEEERHEQLARFLKDEDIPFDSINENMPGLPFKGRKIYYNILLDDRAGLESACYALQDAVDIMKDERREALIKQSIEKNYEALSRMGDE
jgi:hypothetical protein